MADGQMAGSDLRPEVIGVEVQLEQEVTEVTLIEVKVEDSKDGLEDVMLLGKDILVKPKIVNYDTFKDLRQPIEEITAEYIKEEPEKPMTIIEEMIVETEKTSNINSAVYHEDGEMTNEELGNNELRDIREPVEELTAEYIKEEPEKPTEMIEEIVVETDKTTNVNSAKSLEDGHMKMANNNKLVKVCNFDGSDPVVTFPCNACQYQAKRRTDLTKHNNRVHDGKIGSYDNPQIIKFKCGQCPFQANRKSNLREHKLNIHDGVTYDCELCPYAAKTRKTLKRHQGNAHEGVKYSCDLCGFEDTLQMNLKTHRLRVHFQGRKIKVKKENVTKYKCDQCDSQFGVEGSLKKHKLSIHDGIKYNCDECTYKATQEGNLKTHKQNVHQGVKYICDQCANHFTDKGSLRKHILSLHEGVKYTCTQCDFQFTDQGSLKKHKLSIHEGLKYTCDYVQCDYEATTPRIVKKHKLKVHTDAENS